MTNNLALALVICGSTAAGIAAGMLIMLAGFRRKRGSRFVNCKDCVYWGSWKDGGGRIERAIRTDGVMRCTRQDNSGFIIANCDTFLMKQCDGCTKGKEAMRR